MDVTVAATTAMLHAAHLGSRTLGLSSYLKILERDLTLDDVVLSDENSTRSVVQCIQVVTGSLLSAVTFQFQGVVCVWRNKEHRPTFYLN
jgi:hypothetical protein